MTRMSGGTRSGLRTTGLLTAGHHHHRPISGPTTAYGVNLEQLYPQSNAWTTLIHGYLKTSIRSRQTNVLSASSTLNNKSITEDGARRPKTWGLRSVYPMAQTQRNMYSFSFGDSILISNIVKCTMLLPPYLLAASAVVRSSVSVND